MLESIQKLEVGSNFNIIFILSGLQLTSHLFESSFLPCHFLSWFLSVELQELIFFLPISRIHLEMFLQLFCSELGVFQGTGHFFKIYCQLLYKFRVQR